MGSLLGRARARETASPALRRRSKASFVTVTCAERNLYTNAYPANRNASTERDLYANAYPTD